jgi:hypothetical protein
MLNKVVMIFVAAAFVAASGAAWPQVGGNAIPKYGNVDASKNRTVTKHGAGGNATPTYPKVEASKNKTITKHGAGGNATPTYAKTGTH